MMPDVFVPVTDFEIASNLFDKVEAAKSFKEAGLPIPRTYSVLNAHITPSQNPAREVLRVAFIFSGTWATLCISTT